MKTILSLFVIVVTSIGCAQTLFVAPEWKVTMQVLDENGNPIPNAQASVGYVKPHSGDRAGSVDGKTDTNGLFTASGRSYSRLYLNVKRDGYYSASKIYDIYVADKPRYEPWNPTITLMLKKIIKPIPLYAKQIRMKIPQLNKAIGYDLMIGDWVGSYGKGVNTDLFFAETHTNAEYILSISFPRTGDGIQEFTVPDIQKSSGLRSAHEAPLDSYQPEISQTEATNPNRNFYFRIQTKINDRGNIVSAHYGKIYGDLAQFAYYLNPTINSRNIEFDPKQNLMTNLKPDEGVSAP